MSARRARLLVWTALLVAMPVPLVIVGRGYVPVGTLVQLAGATLAIGVLERADGAVGILATVLLAQVMLWAVVGWLLAGLVVGVLRGVAGRALGGVTLALVIIGLAITLVLPVYRSPFHASRARQTLLQVYG
ncbi:MAG TPA: hypothetical protein VNO26_12670 [Candidatus Limnocylindria bacterium]|nr:hypothetical protein [Candidatus Limnocylindria bacterium]